MTTNPYAADARERKATRIEQALLVRGWDADRAANATGTDRASAAAAAGVNPPSDTTWALVVHLMRRARPS